MTALATTTTVAVAAESRDSPWVVQGSLYGAARAPDSDTMWSIGPHSLISAYTPGSGWVTYDPPGSPRDLNDITMLSNTDGWISGSSGYLAHWDGQTWTRQSTEGIPTDWSLDNVSATGPDDVWVQASGYSTEHNKISVWHWDGASWKRTHLNLDIHGGPTDLLAISPGDVWRTEFNYDGDYAEHWNGTSWQPVDVSFDLSQLSAAGASDMWATALSGNGAGAAHWDGSQWSMNNPPGARESDQYAIDATPDGEAWFAASTPVNGGPPDYKTVVAHTEDGVWVADSPPAPCKRQDAYFAALAVDAADSDDVYLTGACIGPGGSYTAAVHFDGDEWSRV